MSSLSSSSPSTFSPIIRVRRLLEKMRSERDSPRPIRRRASSSTPVDDTLLPSSLSTLTPLGERSKMFNSNDGRLVWWTGDNQFERIPAEAVMTVFTYLDSTDLQLVRLVNHEWHNFADDSLIWKNLCFDDWNVDSMLKETWRATYFYLENLFSDGIWEGMSKWIEPAGFDNEQKTTARLHFLKKNKSGIKERSVHSTPKSSPSTIHRVDSAANAIDRLNLINFKESPYRIKGSGITVNCTAPSPFQIDGERFASDSTGCSFQWHKHFEKHTSVYTGTLDFSTGSVSGKISYNDGITLWKGIFFYAKSKKSPNVKNFQVMA